jgi:hypothetical protein
MYMEGDESIFASVWFSISVWDEINEIDLVNLPDGSHSGYMVECELEYPSELQQLHNDYPLAPEHITTTEDMLSPFCNSLNLKCAFTEKLIGSLLPKIKYKTHNRNLKLYLSPDLAENDQVNLSRQGTVRLNLKFGAALAHTITIVAYAEFENMIEIDRNRNIVFDFNN